MGIFECNRDVNLSISGCSSKVACSISRGLMHSVALFVIVNGKTPDDLSITDFGVDFALGKPTFLFKDEFHEIY